MSGSALTLEITDRGLDAVLEAVERIGRPDERFELMDSIGRLVQEQTRRRIAVDKTAPDGTAWQANRRGTSILYASHTLAESIDYISTLDQITVGSPLVYARIHQVGGTIRPKNAKALRFLAGGNGEPIYAKSVTIPARPYLGLSADNVEEIESVVADFMSQITASGGAQ